MACHVYYFILPSLLYLTQIGLPCLHGIIVANKSVVSFNLYYLSNKEKIDPSYQSSVCFARLPFCFYLYRYFSRFICFDILKDTKETIPFLHALLVLYYVVIVFMFISESFETQSMCIQFWLTAKSANDVMVTTFLNSI